MKDMGRLINFSDAVIAIAVTLLALPLIERAVDLHINSFGEFRAAFGQQLLIFLISFAVVCRYWEVHHNLFSSLKAFNSSLFWLNTAWLISIVLIPFTSEIIVNSNDSAFATGIYIGSLLITSYVGVLIQWLVLRSPKLQKPSAMTSLRGTYGVVGALAMTLALVVSIVFPKVGPLSLLLLIPVGYVSRLVRRRA